MTRTLSIKFVALLGWWLLGSTASGQAPSEETLAFFKQNCVSCHTIGGGRLAGPDLKDATKRKDRKWLVDFLLDPKGVIDSGDAYAQQLLKDARGVYMPPVPGLVRERAEKLIDLIAAESALEKSQFIGIQISDRPLTSVDVQLGERLFTGKHDFESKAPACIACHSTREIGGFGGGALGPDLTDAYPRLEGRKALSAWLAAPPSAVMQPIFRQQPLSSDEVLAIVAYLKDVAETGEPASDPMTLPFLLSGCGGAAIVLVLLDFIWRRRYRAVRQPMVEKRS